MAKTVIEEFVAVLGWEIDAKPLEQWNKQVKDITKGIKVAAAAIGAAASAASALIVVTNKQTAEITNLAAALGVSANELEAWGSIVKAIGFDTEKVGDLIEELNNKMGEGRVGGKLLSSVADAMKMLELNYDDLKALSPEDQFTAIMSAAKEMEDQQKAVSAVDMLMGGDANRILGYLRTQEGTLDEILERRRSLIMLDEESRDGAVKFNNLINDATGLLGSLAAQFSGLAGKHLAPMLDQLIEWVVVNRDLIKSGLAKFVRLVAKGLKLFFETIRKGFKILYDFVDAVGGLENAFKLAAFAMAAFASVKVISAISALIGMIKAATVAQLALDAAVALIPFLIGLAVIAIALIAEDIYQFATGGESVLGDLLDFFKGMFDEMVIVAEEFIAEAVLWWAEYLGVSKEDLDQALIAFTDYLVGMYDAAVVWVGEALEVVGAFFVGVANWLSGLWNTVTEVFGGIRDTIATAIGDALGLVEPIFKALLEWPGRILRAIGNIRQAAADKLKDLPLIGGLFGSDNAGAPPAPGPIIPPTNPAPSAGVTNNANNTRNSSIVVSPTLNVTQLPGESGEDFAARVSDVLGEKVGVAVRNNETGIVY